MIINVTIDRIAFARTVQADDVRALRDTIAVTVHEHVSKLPLGERAIAPDALENIGRRVGACVATRCS